MFRNVTKRIFVQSIKQQRNMNEGIKKEIRKQIQKIKDYLKENEGKLTEEEINEALEEIASQIEMLELLDG